MNRLAEHRITWKGSLDMASVERFVKHVEEASGEQKSLVLDLSEMDFVDSTGIRGLIGVKKQLSGEGRSLQISGLSQDVLDILDIMGIRELILD